MLDTIRSAVRNSLSPIARKIVGVNPNTLTLLGLLISMIAAIFFAKGEVMTAGIFLLFSGFLDALDGAVARENGRTTTYGGFLDSVCDRFADAAVLLGAMYGGLTTLSFFPDFPGWMFGSAAIVGSLMVSYTRARAEAAGGSASVGIGERAVRMTILIFGAFLDIVGWSVLLIAVISFITVFQRIEHVRRTLK